MGARCISGGVNLPKWHTHRICTELQSWEHGGLEVVLPQALKGNFADAGMFKAAEPKQGGEHKEKKKGHRFHLRHKHKQKDASNASKQSPGHEELDGSESSPIHPSEADGTKDVSNFA